MNTNRTTAYLLSAVSYHLRIFTMTWKEGANNNQKRSCSNRLPDMLGRNATNPN